MYVNYISRLCYATLHHKMQFHLWLFLLQPHVAKVAIAHVATVRRQANAAAVSAGLDALVANVLCCLVASMVPVTNHWSAFVSLDTLDYYVKSVSCYCGLLVFSLIVAYRTITISSVCVCVTL